MCRARLKLDPQARRPAGGAVHVGARETKKIVAHSGCRMAAYSPSYVYPKTTLLIERPTHSQVLTGRLRTVEQESLKPEETVVWTKLHS